MKRFSSLFQARVGGVLLKTLLLIFGFAGLSPALADTPGTWTPTGSMATARQGYSATLLPNGKVLVAGGDSGPTVFASAELYDPATGTWASTGSMGSARSTYTAMLLPNGKVLVAGGIGSSGKLASAELYDPATGTWASTGSMGSARSHYPATLLPNGKVLVAGGQDSSADLASAELYDPATGTWASTGSLATARFASTATLLPNGKVLVAGGGLNGGNSFLASSELYDPATGTWSSTGAMVSTRGYQTATLLPNGKVLVAGGLVTCCSVLASAELYDPATGAWASTGSLATTRFASTAMLLPNGKVLVAGGHSGSVSLASAELYDPATGAWASIGAMVTARQTHRATLLPNGKVLVAGGNNGSAAIASAELYCPEMPGTAGTFAATGSMTFARNQARLIVLTLGPNAGKALIAGRNGNSFTDKSAELFNPATGTWATTGTPSTTRQGYVSVVLPNGKVLMAGGYPAPGGFLSSAELYDPIAGTWSITGSMAFQRGTPMGALLTIGPNAGKVLIVGGRDNSGSLASAELYNPATGTWAGTGSMATGRHNFTATLLPNGKVLVVGGANQALGQGVPTAELYDPATGTWTGTNSMSTARFDHAALVLTSGPNAGKVLVTGGLNATFTTLASAELYDPATGTWAGTGSMANARQDSQNSFATLLPNGKVLVVGGSGSGGDLSSAELYDPATGAWTSTGSMTAARSQHAMTLLPTGQVLVTGGSSAGLASAELFSTAICASSAPAISAISPTSGFVGTSVTISGSNFGATQGTNTVKFNGVTASVSSWSDTQVVATVPSGATTGAVVVTVNGVPSNNDKIFTVITDGIAPTTTASATPAANGAGWNNSDVTVTLTATDNVGGSGVQSITYTLTGAQVGGGSVASSSTSILITTEGTTSITFHARDNAGNIEGDHSVTVKLDKTAPVLTVPANMTVNATSPSGAVVTFTPSATDATSGVASLTSSPASGSTFALGTTTVTVTATDAAGNSSTATFTVTVQDTTPPVIGAVSNLTAEATSAAGAVVTFALPTAADTVDAAPVVTASPASGSTFALGVTTVTVTATDDAGNSSTTTFTVTVQDTTPPTVTVPASITASATSPAGAVVLYSASVADLVDAAPTLTCAPASGTTFAVGSTTVTCTAADHSGNNASKSFQVTVEGPAAQIQSLTVLVQSFNLQQGLENSLDAKLQNALDALNSAIAGNIASACNKLTALINEVQAQSGTKITPAQASQLIAAASQIKASSGCP